MSINYETQTYSGIHMVCDIKKIKNKELLNNVSQLKELLDNIEKEINEYLNKAIIKIDYSISY
jgi:hypothetical protein